MTDDPTVTAEVKWVAPLRRGFDGVWRLTVACCPFCGGKYFHGGGAGPAPHIGHRVADCGKGASGYYLALPPPPAALILAQGVGA
jgi:hypothetical protein